MTIPTASSLEAAEGLLPDCFCGGRATGHDEHCPAHYRSAVALAIQVRDERIQELEASFSLRWNADMRAIERWRRARTGREMTLPDHADLCVFLLKKADEPIDMILFCPACGTQHVDEPDERTVNWENPPHRSHLCHSCGHIWRPADVATNGVKAITTIGGADSPAVDSRAQIVALEAEVTRLREALGRLKNYADLNRTTADYHRGGVLMSDLKAARAALSPATPLTEGIQKDGES